MKDNPTFEEQIVLVQTKNRARSMAARLKNKQGAEQEPRSAHGRALKNNNKHLAEQEPRSAYGRVVKKTNYLLPSQASATVPHSRTNPFGRSLTSTDTWTSINDCDLCVNSHLYRVELYNT